MSKVSSREEEVRLVLARTFAVVQSTLVYDYGLPPEEAARLSQELFEWFDRLTRRPGTPTSIQGLRTQLISMTCKVGHVYWAAKTDSEQPADETVRRTLTLGPDVIAYELEKRIEQPEAPED